MLRNHWNFRNKFPLNNSVIAAIQEILRDFLEMKFSRRFRCFLSNNVSLSNVSTFSTQNKSGKYTTFVFFWLTRYIPSKSPWEEVEKEMVNEKGLPKETADKIGVYVQQKGLLPIRFWYSHPSPSPCLHLESLSSRNSPTNWGSFFWRLHW